MKTIYVETDLHKKMKIIAAEKGISIGDLVKLAIEILEGKK